MKKLFYKAILKSFSKLFLLKLFVLASLSKREWQETIKVFSNSMLLKRDSTSKLVMYNPESYSITSLANSKLFLMVNLLVAIGSKLETKCLAIL